MFYVLRQHRTSQIGLAIKTIIFDPDEFINEVEALNLKEELRFCEHLLVDFELEMLRHIFSNHPVENLNEMVVNEKLHLFFNNLKCAAKVNITFASIWKT